MELDDFFENKQQNRRYDPDHRFQDRPRHAQNFRYPYHRHDSNFKWMHFLESLKNNRKLKGLLVFAIIFILGIIIALIVVLLPLIFKLVSYISQNGVQGILENATAFLDQLWKGSGK